MNRNKAVNLWIAILIAFELAVPALWGFSDLPGIDHFRKWVPFLYAPAMIGLCSMAQVRTKAGWFVFLRSLWFVFLLLWLLLPVCFVWYPDLTSGRSILPAFMVAYGVGAVLFTLIYVSIIPVFFSSSGDHWWEWVVKRDFSPDQGKTVQALKNGLELPRNTFLFEKGSRNFTTNWKAISRMVFVFSESWKKSVGKGLVLLMIWPALIYWGSGGSQGAFERDVERLWNFRPDRTDERFVVPTRGAMEAARRLFADEDAFKGLTQSEARKLLQVERKDERYVLDKPAFSWHSEQLIFRMSNERESVELLAGYDDDQRIQITWMRESESGN